MDQELYRKYLKDYALEALTASGGDVSQAADFLADIKEPKFFTRHKQEKKAALDRARKVFHESRDRSAWIALKSLGLDEAAKEYL